MAPPRGGVFQWLLPAAPAACDSHGSAPGRGGQRLLPAAPAACDSHGSAPGRGRAAGAARRHVGAGGAAVRGAAAGVGAADGGERRAGALGRGGGAAGRGRLLPPAGGHAEQLAVPQAHAAAAADGGGLQPGAALEQRRGGVWLRGAGRAALPGAQGGRAVLPGGPRGEPGGAGAGHQHPQGLRRDRRASARLLPGWEGQPGAAGGRAQRRVHADGRPAQVLPARDAGGAGGRPPADEGGPPGPAEQLQDRRAAAVLRLRGQRGEVGEPRPGAAAPAAAHRPQPGAEPLPVPGLLRAQPRRQRHLLRPGAPGRLHQPSQRPLDAARRRRHAAEPHLLDPRRPGERPLPADPAVAAEGAGRPRAPALLPLRGGGGAARAGLEGRGAGPLPPALHVLGRAAGRAGRLLRVQRPGEGRRAQGLRRHPGGGGAAAQDEGAAGSGGGGGAAAGGLPAVRPGARRPGGGGQQPRGGPGRAPARHVPRALRLLRRQPGAALRHRRGAPARRPAAPRPRQPRGRPEGAAGLRGAGRRRRRPQDAAADGQRHGEPAGGGEPPGRAAGRAPGPAPPRRTGPRPRHPPAARPPARRPRRLPEVPLRPPRRPPLQLRHRRAPGGPPLPGPPLPDQLPPAPRARPRLPLRPEAAHDRPHGPAAAALAPLRVLAGPAALSRGRAGGRAPLPHGPGVNKNGAAARPRRWLEGGVVGARPAGRGGARGGREDGGVGAAAVRAGPARHRLPLRDHQRGGPDRHAGRLRRPLRPLRGRGAERHRAGAGVLRPRVPLLLRLGRLRPGGSLLLRGAAPRHLPLLPGRGPGGPRRARRRPGRHRRHPLPPARRRRRAARRDGCAVRLGGAGRRPEQLPGGAAEAVAVPRRRPLLQQPLQRPGGGLGERGRVGRAAGAAGAAAAAGGPVRAAAARGPRVERRDGGHLRGTPGEAVTAGPAARTCGPGSRGRQRRGRTAEDGTPSLALALGCSPPALPLSPAGTGTGTAPPASPR